MKRYKIFVGKQIYYLKTNKLIADCIRNGMLFLENCAKEPYGKDDNIEYVDLYVYGDFHIEVLK